MNSKELREKRAPLAVEIKRLADLVNDENRDFTAEEKEKWETVNQEYNDLTRQIELAERAEAVAADQVTPVAPPPAIPGRDDMSGRQVDDDGDNQAPTEEDRSLALQAWCRSQSGISLDERHERAAQVCGVNPLARHLDISLHNMSEVRALSAEVGASGSYTVPEGFVNSLELALLQFGGMRAVADIMRTSEGNDIPWPTSDDTGNTGAQIGENTAVTEQDVAFKQTLFKAYKYTSKLVKVPVELLEDSAFDIASLL
ncbi:MAG: phage major capsid protein, partial [Paracoccaceae bacterium]